MRAGKIFINDLKELQLLEKVSIILISMQTSFYTRAVGSKLENYIVRSLLRQEVHALNFVSDMAR